LVLLGPRQVGKSTLALDIGEQRSCVYFRVLQNEDGRAKLANPAPYFADHENEVVILVMRPFSFLNDSLFSSNRFLFSDYCNRLSPPLA
jgi:predicted AAA+ superfamily ATPase